ncbi:hydroxyisourate hydrolase [Haloquadratum walsbyi]|jgi:hydroxyisourate hydrolase|uniref:hydroxyisourate hydrolase n=1 Tax=Haloquadratum walsbyi J07HQW2 TaxID=1238425 RepID=U1NJM9_9EURY|nr:hydroxyisourate hydrolase [Haloquadratum walsbyi]ERG97158.1 MAG: hydroxyisourate hydrolase [Haloquadratum walsbyi J07HQW2]
MSAGLTTHVLDTSREGPAAGVSVTLRRLEEDSEVIASGVTNDDGRLEEPLLDSEEIESGTYELVFDVETYYQDKPSGTTFLGEVPVRFKIDNADEHYHVPLLLSPGGYTTYRGS